MKILILTVESWNSKFGANTFSSIFQNVPNSEYANICIRDEIPDSNFCKRYFRISEPKVIRSVLFRHTKTGKEVFCNQSFDSVDKKDLSFKNELYNKNRHKRSYIKLMIRELFWKLGVWKTKELKNFLSDFDPDLIAYEMSGYLHFNRLCRFAVKYTNAKSIGYFWDDNFTYKQRKCTPGFLIFRFLQRKSLKKLAGSTDAFWAITDKTKREADSFFGINSTVLTKPITNTEKRDFACQKHTPIKMLYTGNLGIGRLDTIKVISKALDELNQDEKQFELDVYTGTYISDKEKRSIGEGVIFHQPIPQNDVIELQKQADILLFVEDINGKSSKIARLSFSTKLTDYFAAGKCILAVAAKDIAPMEYLSDNDAALVASDYQTVVSQLQRITQNVELVDEYAERAYNLGQQNHKSEIIISKLKNTIETVLLNEKM